MREFADLCHISPTIYWSSIFSWENAPVVTHNVVAQYPPRIYNGYSKGSPVFVPSTLLMDIRYKAKLRLPYQAYVSSQFIDGNFMQNTIFPINNNNSYAENAVDIRLLTKPMHVSNRFLEKYLAENCNGKLIKLIDELLRLGVYPFWTASVEGVKRCQPILF
jgi:hypothetical protein